ncbi:MULTISPECIES: hypothetical protein [Myxococcus]|uniref:hypothetical protein n=1 Tax=Myxococcus TaxID=32 RepID=UPI00112C3EB8|nr:MULTISPECIES: hypothetical protein [Myxococcus]QDE94489.1 hypothetical protein BHS05_00585 [Myxococcus xanthus]WAM26633.1 hypothetical protein OZ403_00520 [Myxococcus sp. NMCA1]
MLGAMTWGRCLPLAACIWIVIPVHAASADSDFERHVAEAVRLYDDLEYERALEQLDRARGSLRGTRDRMSLALYRGIISADLGRWQAARDEFRSALLQEPGARLPLRVSPKVSREFEAQRALAKAELARRRKDSPTREAERVEQSEVETESIADASSGLPAALIPDQQATASSPMEVQGTPATSSAYWMRIGGRQVPLASLVLLGAGIAAGGTGTVFGVSSRGQIADAREARFYEHLVAHHSRAQRSARTANVLFGTAGVAAAGALVTWLLLGERDEAVTQQGGVR